MSGHNIDHRLTPIYKQGAGAGIEFAVGAWVERFQGQLPGIQVQDVPARVPGDLLVLRFGTVAGPNPALIEIANWTSVAVGTIGGIAFRTATGDALDNASWADGAPMFVSQMARFRLAGKVGSFDAQGTTNTAFNTGFDIPAFSAIGLVDRLTLALYHRGRGTNNAGMTITDNTVGMTTLGTIVKTNLGQGGLARSIWLGWSFVYEPISTAQPLVVQGYTPPLVTATQASRYHRYKFL